MILVDTSVWIELLAGRMDGSASSDDIVRFVTCSPIVQEVLQGLRYSSKSETFRNAFLALPRLSDPLPLNLFLEAADIYREGRHKGYTIRSSTNCLIAAIAIQNKVPVWHRDRDFNTISRFTSLRVVEHPASYHQ